MVLTVPWPGKELSPNTRQHWGKLASAKKAYRAACGWTAKEQGAKALTAATLHVAIVFVPPNRHAHDLDNCLARFKAGIDGLVDVLGVDDKHWTLDIKKSTEVGGMVRVTVTEVA